MLIKKLKIADLKPAEYNPRQSSKEQEAHLKASLTKFGVVEPIIVNTNPERNNIIIGGHFRVRELKKMGEKEVDCVLLNLSLEDEKELNIRLNSNTGGWDFDALANNFDLEDLTAWGLDAPELDTEKEGVEDNNYTRKIEIPIYTPTGDCPNVSELVNSERANTLIEKIKIANLPDDLKEFLIKSAYRHNVFDYKKIAEFYAHQPKEIQGLFEESALVIIDFERAIELNFVKMVDQIQTLVGSNEIEDEEVINAEEEQE